eukprot:gene26982-8995_t
MGSSRVMGDATILPNGNVIVLNEAQTGVAGNSKTGVTANSTDIITHINTLATIATSPLLCRLTGVTANSTDIITHVNTLATIATSPLLCTLEVKAEYRMEIFYPPGWYDFDAKPKIESAPTTITYGENFLVAYAGQQSEYGTVTRAVLVAPGATTHSFNTNQRVVGLVVNDNDEFGQVLTLVAPPNANIAPSQKFMLFLLNGDTYSKATWVHLA